MGLENPNLSDFIAFTDADCIPTPTWLEGLLHGFRDSNVGSVGGPHIAPVDSSAFQRRVEDFFVVCSFAVDFFKGSHDEIIEVPHNPLCNVMYRTAIFKSVGGFPEDLFPGEDTEMDFKVVDRGYQILYNPRALVFHHRPETIQQFKKVMHAYGRAQGKLIREYGLRRRIQWIGIVSLFALTWLFLSFLLAANFFGFIVDIALIYIVFYYRPKTESKFGIFCNALQWFNGLIEGFITKRSLPPGYQQR